MKREKSKHQTQNTKNTAGITLIALIITIVILLILATVSIQLLMNGGIIAHAENAVDKYDIAQTNEQAQLAGVESYIEGIVGGGNSPTTYLTQNDKELEKLAAGVTLIEYENLEEGSKLKTLADNGKIKAVLTDGTYKAVIPSGFSILTTSEDGETIAGGLVVVDEQGNEFVWVPVPDDINTSQYISATNYIEPATIGEIQIDSYGNITGYTYDANEANLERATCEDTDTDGILELSDFETELTNIYKEMAESVNECDGFYVGRYEVSFNESRKAQSKGSTESEPVYSAINSTISTNNNNATDWYGLYALCKTYNTSSVQSSMIWGIQYNKMMTWMGDAANTTIGDNRNKERTCGTAPNDVIKNIYDLYGNSYEWTLEAWNTDHRAGRGGRYDIGGFSPSSYTNGVPTGTYSYQGSRLTLYIV